MGIVKTNKWLKKYIDEMKWDSSILKSEQLQLRLLIAPMYKELDLKEQVNKYRFFINQGLFYPNEKREEIEQLLACDIWETCAIHLNMLKNEWNGPDIRVYLFPANKHQEGGKNGLYYDDRLLLFVRSNCTDDEVLALLTHEYHHVCRLHQQNYHETTIPLIESLVMEGLAEYAVKEYVGEHELAAWTTWYSREKLQMLWEKTFARKAQLLGRFHHYPYLFGSLTMEVPRLAGYAVGYFIVSEYIKRVGKRATTELFQVSAMEMSKNILLNE